MAVVLTILMAVFVTPSAQAGVTGRLKGKIIDKDSQQPLPGAAVKIEGTYFETTSNSDGEFSFIGVDAGTYDIRVELDGYARQSITGFAIYPDMANEILFELSPRGTDDHYIVLDAESVPSKSDDPYMRRLVDAKTFSRQPHHSLNDIILQSSGDVYQRSSASLLPLGERFMRNNQLFFRGGSSSDAGYYLDGLRLTDANTGTTYLSLPYNAIGQVVVQTGGYDAKYGQFGAGMTQIVPKRGGETFQSSAELVTDAFGSALGSNSYGHNVYSLTFSGPINDRIRFFTALDYDAAEDADPGVFGNPVVKLNTGGSRNANPALNDTAIFVTDQNGRLKYKQGARPDRVNASDLTNFYANVSYTPNAVMQFDLTTLFSSIKRNQFSSQLLLSPSGVLREERSTYVVNLSGKYVLSSSMFLEGHIGMYSSDDKIAARKFFEMGDKAITFLNASTRGNTGANTYYGDNFIYDIDRGRLDYKKSESDAWFGGINFNWQLNKEHFIESGIEFDSHTERLLDLIDIGNPVGGSNNVYGYTIYNDDFGLIAVRHQDKNNFNSGLEGSKKPTTASFFIQDNYSIDKFTFSGGLRADYLSTGVKTVYLDPYVIFWNSNQVVKINEGKSYVKWSPRLAFSTEFSKNVSVRANYGWFYHLPAFENYLVSSNMVEQQLLAPIGPIYEPNPVLEPEKTEAVEFGLCYHSDRVNFDAALFRNNVSDVIMKGEEPGYVSTLWTLDNSGSSIVTGINFHFEDRIADNFSMGAFATFLHSKTTASESSSGFRADWLMDNLFQVSTSSDNEQRTTLKFFAEGRLLKGEGPVFGNVHPLENSNLFVWINRASGFPYTPTEISRYGLFSSNLVQTDPVNSRTTPPTMTVDVKFTKQFDAFTKYHASVYLEILNLLNRKNPVQVFSATGQGDTDAYLGTSGAQTLNTRQLQQYQYVMKDNLHYSNPRLVNLGFKIEF